ncbi:MAG: hypothetical protein IPM29_19895 [Planctomycetes bacterium]|nr:hypothetical protein [Planctomycetota bacterium]
MNTLGMVASLTKLANGLEQQMEKQRGAAFRKLLALYNRTMELIRVYAIRRLRENEGAYSEAVAGLAQAIEKAGDWDRKITKIAAAIQLLRDALDKVDKVADELV